MTGFATAEEFKSAPSPKHESGLLKKNPIGSPFNRIHYERGNTQSRFLLEFNKRACLMKCDSQFESCMSSAGDSADAKFRCGEKRWACTRGCDAQTNKPFKF